MFNATIIQDPENAKKGKLSLGSDYNRARFQDYLNKNVGLRLNIEPLTPTESRKMRKWFEGAIIPFITYYQEGMDWRNKYDREKVREWLKSEFNSDYAKVAGIVKLVPVSTKGHLKQFTEKVIDWANEQGYNIDIVNSELFKKWRDEIQPMTGQAYFLDYLIETKQI